MSMRWVTNRKKNMRWVDFQFIHCYIEHFVFKIWYKFTSFWCDSCKFLLFEMQKELGFVILIGGLDINYSQVLTHHCLMRRLLPAVFPPWADASLIKQPCDMSFHPCYNIDTRLSADTCSKLQVDCMLNSIFSRWYAFSVLFFVSVKIA